MSALQSEQHGLEFSCHQINISFEYAINDELLKKCCIQHFWNAVLHYFILTDENKIS